MKNDFIPVNEREIPWQKILVIDDLEEIRTLVKRVLSQEHEVFTIESWVEARNYIYKYDLDLILMDVNMPSLSGDKLTEVLLKTVKNKPLNIVLFSAMDEFELRKKARKVGAKGYIPKTLDENVLRARVQKFLR